MKKLRFLVLAIAAVAMVGLVSCKSTVKEETKVDAVEEVVDAEEVAPCTDSTMTVADTVAVEESADVEEVSAE